MAKILRPETPSVEQRVLVLGGMGGIGKTQLAIAYAKRYRTCYSSTFWLNATSPSMLQGSLRMMARRVLPHDAEREFDDYQIRVRTAGWLSRTNNSRWLLIFDSYDALDQFNIKDYFPPTSHGSIIITSRIPEEVCGDNIILRPIENQEECLRILATRSGRHDVGSSK